MIKETLEEINLSITKMQRRISQLEEDIELLKMDMDLMPKVVTQKVQPKKETARSIMKGEGINIIEKEIPVDPYEIEEELL